MTHWKKLTNPNYLGAYSLDDGKDMILTIKYVQNETVTGADGKKEECTVCHFTEQVKPMILNVTNMKQITKIVGSPYVEHWAGHKIQIGSERVKAFGEIVEALRVRPTAPKAEPDAPDCTACGQKVAPASGMTSEQVAAYTKKNYGRVLCAACAAKVKGAKHEAEQ